jgi:magnesium transporter
MNESSARYKPETAGSIMTTDVPTCLPFATAGQVLKLLTNPLWDEARHVFVLDKNGALVGVVHIARLIRHAATTQVAKLMHPVMATLSPEDDQEKAIFLAVKNDLDVIAVVDKSRTFLGVVSAKAIIDIMHDEHLEDILLSAGIRHAKGADIVKLATARFVPIISSRAPWLIVGAVVGVGLGFVSSWFESSLEKSIALAYFIPVVAYIADSVGTQSEAITVRALATLKLRYGSYLVREVAIGFILGLVLGTIGFLGAWFISQSLPIGLVVGISLVVASTAATGLASLVPITFKKLGKDPALGSGPIATALQDVISIILYFTIAFIVLR